MPTVDKSILNSKLNQGESYLEELAFAICVNGESIEKYKKIVEKKYDTNVYSNMVQFANFLDQQTKHRQFTNTSLLSLKFLGKNAGLSEMTIDMIVDHLRGEFREEQLKEEKCKHEDTAFWKQCNPNNKYQLQEYLKKYPTGQFATRAVSLMADLERIEKKVIEESRVFYQCTTQRDYMNYLSKYPNGTYSVKAKAIIEEFGKKKIEENRVYNLCKNKSDYLGYLRKYPNGKYVKEVQNKIKALENAENSMTKETAFWNQCSPNSIPQLQEHLRKYPKGMYTTRAKSLIANLGKIRSEYRGDNNNSGCKVTSKNKKKIKLSIKEILILLISTIVLYAVAYLIRDECETLGPILFGVSIFTYMIFAFEVVSYKGIGMAICITGWFVMMFLWSDYAILSSQSILPALVILVICSFGAAIAYLCFMYEK